MDRKTAHTMIDVANDKGLCDMLQAYAEHRISILNKTLQLADDTVSVYRTQGAIAELRRFETIRQEILDGAKK